jgi:hypothetical protein
MIETKTAVPTIAAIKAWGTTSARVRAITNPMPPAMSPKTNRFSIRQENWLVV